jgi:hypothetical protein
MTEYREPGTLSPLNENAVPDPDTGVTPPQPILDHGPEVSGTGGEPQQNGLNHGEGAGPDWHAEAGRKGARRIHQLIQQGNLYEQEHGLKRGRQRLRQLIEEGKLYEQEQRLKAGGEVPGRRLPRMSSDQALLTLFQGLLRLVKPAVRRKLARVLQTLENEKV